MNCSLFKTVIIIVAVSNYAALGANILGIAPIRSTSHFKVFQPVFLELAKLGHNVTVISGMSEANLPTNYRMINVNIDISNHALVGANKKSTVDQIRPRNFIVNSLVTWTILMHSLESSLNASNVRDFIANDQSHFDLVICEEFNILPFYMFAHKYKAPLITYTAYGGAHYISNFMGNPMNLQHVVHEFDQEFTDYSVWERMYNVVCTFSTILIRQYYFMPKYQNLAEKYFSSFPQPLPDLRDIEKNTALHFMNSHYSMDTVRSFLPNMLQIGGIHIDDTKPLPEDLQQLIDNATHGVIYFSMGSFLDSDILPDDKIAIFVEVFSKMKETILWKFNGEDLPGKAENIILRKWLPQNDVLAHPNIRLFLTHGGLLSNQEAVSKGVPIVGMPFFGDQRANMGKARKLGYAEYVDYYTLTVKTLSEALNKVLNDPSYHNKAKEISRTFQDRPLSAMNTAVYWIEYVIKHNGAYHLKAPSLNMAWHEYYLVDVTIIILFGILLGLFLIFHIFKLFFKLLFVNRIKSTMELKKKNC